MNYSITFRPRLETYESIEEPFNLFLQDLTKYSESYIVSKESGRNSKKDNHLQIFTKLKKSIKQKSYRKRLMRTLTQYVKLDKQETINSLKVKEIKTNLEGVKGYVCKEDGDKLIYGFTAEDIKELRKYYESNTKKENKDYFRINRKNYHIYVKKWIGLNKEVVLSFVNEELNDIQQKIKNIEDVFYERYLLKKIIDRMIIEDYYFTFITPRNIDEVLKYLQATLDTDVSYMDWCDENRVIIE